MDFYDVELFDTIMSSLPFAYMYQNDSTDIVKTIVQYAYASCGIQTHGMYCTTYLCKNNTTYNTEKTIQITRFFRNRMVMRVNMAVKYDTSDFEISCILERAWSWLRPDVYSAHESKMKSVVQLGSFKDMGTRSRHPFMEDVIHVDLSTLKQYIENTRSESLKLPFILRSSSFSKLEKRYEFISSLPVRRILRKILSNVKTTPSEEMGETNQMVLYLRIELIRIFKDTVNNFYQLMESDVTRIIQALLTTGLTCDSFQNKINVASLRTLAFLWDIYLSCHEKLIYPCVMVRFPVINRQIVQKHSPHLISNELYFVYEGDQKHSISPAGCVQFHLSFHPMDHVAIVTDSTTATKNGSTNNGCSMDIDNTVVNQRVSNLTTGHTTQVFTKGSNKRKYIRVARTKRVTKTKTEP